MPFARSYTYNITLEIPLGYSLEGADDLFCKVENETGGFVSKAKIENNKLVLNTYKYYQHNFEKKEDWPKMMEFLQEATSFNTKKVLLKKL